jgi:hypothetical protein
MIPGNKVGIITSKRIVTQSPSAGKLLPLRCTEAVDTVVAEPRKMSKATECAVAALGRVLRASNAQRLVPADVWFGCPGGLRARENDHETSRSGNRALAHDLQDL